MVRPDAGPIAIVSEDLSLPLDEGLKKFVFCVASHLSRSTPPLMISTRPEGPLPPEVLHCPSGRLMQGSTLKRELAAFGPDRLIYVPRAAGTRNAFIRSQMLGRLVPGAKIMMVSLQQRHYGPAARAFIRRFHPYITVSQGLETRDQLRRLDIPSMAIPSGVDHDMFRPASRDERRRLRLEHGIDPERFVILHVGHLRTQRNVELLGRLRQTVDADVVMVASTSTTADVGLGEKLRARGVHIIDRYVPDVADFYRIADCYLFPVHVYYGAIEMPLSVLEAMSCGIPVVSTPFGSLPYWLEPGPGIEYAASDDTLVEAVRRHMSSGLPSDPEVIRERSRGFSWPAIADRLLKAFDGVCDAEAGTDDLDKQVADRSEDVARCAS